MRLFSAVFPIFLGLIVSSSARSLFSNNNQPDGEDSSSSSEEDIRESLEQIQAACYEKTGSNDTFKAIMSHFHGIPVCILVNMDVFSFVEDLDSLDSVTRHQFFPKYCPQMRRSLECVEPLLREFRKCLEEEDALMIRAISHAMPEAIDLICDKNGEILFVEDANYTTCIDSFSNYVDECGGMISNVTDVMKVSNYGETQCDELEKARKCLGEKMTHCNGPRLMDLFDVVYRAFVSASPCSNFITLPNHMTNDTLKGEGNATPE